MRGFTVGWIESLASDAGRVVVLALEKRHESDNPRVEVLTLGKERYAGFWRHFYYAYNWHRAMCRIMRDMRPVIVFTHMAPLYSVLAYPYAQIWAVPVVTWFVHPRGSFLLRLAHILSTRSVSVSSRSYPYPDKKVISVGHGIDTDFFRPDVGISARERLVIVVGRISRIKNISLCIQAITSLNEPCTLAVIGNPLTPQDRAYEVELRRSVQAAGLDATVRFIPVVSALDLRTWYCRAMVQVNCTEVGSSDKVIIEGMACGLPCITVSPAFADACGENATLLSGVLPDAKSIADRIRAIFAMPDECYRVLRAAMRAGVEDRYSLQLFSRRLTRIFYDISSSR